MKTRSFWLVLSFTAVALSTGCEKPDPFSLESFEEAKVKHDMTIPSGMRGNSYPAQFNRLFPGAHNHLSGYYPGEPGKTNWHSKAALHERYVLHMVCEIKLDNTRTNIISIDPPIFLLHEFTGVTPNLNGAPVIQERQVITFSADDWNRLVEAKGDFRVLGITLETNKPVKNFAPTCMEFPLDRGTAW